MKISDEDRARIASAVGAAEGHTSGEIRCVLATEAVDNRLFGVSLAAGAALVLPAAALLFGFHPETLIRAGGGWTVGHLNTADEQTLMALTAYIGLQAAIFAAVGLATLWAPLAHLLTPGFVLKARVHRAAVAQFEALGLANTRDRTGVLLFVSLAERRAEVLADTGIYAKAPPAVWDEVVGLLIAGLKKGDPASGFVMAVKRTGTILAACLPPRSDDANELPDTLVEVRR